MARPLADETFVYQKDPLHPDQHRLFRINNLLSVHTLRSVKLLMAYPPLMRAMGQLVGHDHFACRQSACVFKIPGCGAPQPWHQDGSAIFRYPVFNVDIYLDHATEDNGCLQDMVHQTEARKQRYVIPHRLTADAVALRQAAFPNEPKLDYRLIGPGQLECAPVESQADGAARLTG